MNYLNRMLSYKNIFFLNKRFLKNNSKIGSGNLFSFPLADIGEGITEVELIQWYTTPGNKIKEFDKICEVMSDKANVEITSPYDATIKELHCEIGKMAKVGEPLVTMQLIESTASFSEIKQSEIKPSELTSESQSNISSKKNVTTPAVRRIAKENNIDLSLIIGTGPDRRILKKDLMNYLKKKLISTQNYSLLNSSFPIFHLVFSSTIRSEDKVLPIMGIKRFMVKKMDKAVKIACFGYGDEIKMNRLMEIRDRLKLLAKKENVKLSYMPFILKATSLSLLEFPHLNAHVNDRCTEVIHRKDHNIGLAVDSSQGLVVPNIKNIQTKSIFQVAKDMNNLIERVRNQTITQEDLKGGTLTLSNIGSIGGTVCRPILFTPEVIIAALGKIHVMPVYENKQLVARHLMHCQWTADHRVLDGANVARFCNKWKTYIEEPDLMILHLS